MQCRHKTKMTKSKQRWHKMCKHFLNFACFLQIHLLDWTGSFCILSSVSRDKFLLLKRGRREKEKTPLTVANMLACFKSKNFKWFYFLCLFSKFLYILKIEKGKGKRFRVSLKMGKVGPSCHFSRGSVDLIRRKW